MAAKRHPDSIEDDPNYGRMVPEAAEEYVEEVTDDDWSDDSPDVIENDDGSADVIVSEESDVQDDDFTKNIAEGMESSALLSMATEWLELIERDKEARQKRDEQYEEGIRRTGLGNDAPGGAQFDGASRVVHPVLAEGCVDFASRAIKELVPPNGPVKTHIVGKTDGKKLQKAQRKRDFMNWQLMYQCTEFRAEMEQLLVQLPLGGSQFLKVYPDFDAGRPRFEFIPIDKMLLPFSCNDFYSAQRATHIQEITEQEFESRVESGYYRDLEIYTPPEDPTETKAQKASNKVEGKQMTAYNEDGLRKVYEITCYTKIEDDKYAKGKLAPYIICVDETLSDVLAIYRNWEQNDERMEKLDWIIEFGFIPWRGAYKIGLLHLIGGMAAALTGALRALLDSAHINNSATMLKLKGARTSGQTNQVDVTQVAEIEGPAGVDDVRKIAMAMPFNPPSPVLFQLLDWLTNAAKGVVGTAEEKIADASNQMPVGTALALIEQGSYTYSAIHSRLHSSMAKVLNVVCRIDYSLLDEEEVFNEFDEETIYRDDFKTDSDIVPVSDPNIFSESQRYAQIQAVMQLATQAMQAVDPATGKPLVSYDMYEINRRALELMKVQDADDILPPKHKPTRMNAVAENVTVMLGNEIIVMPDQDHMSHIESHLRFATDPNYGASPLAATTVIPALLDHIKQHMAFLYAGSVQLVAEQSNIDPTTLKEHEIDQLLAAVTAKVSVLSKQTFEPIQVMLKNAQQLLQANTPPPPQDPTVQAQVQIAMAEIERQKVKDQNDLQMAQVKVQAQQQIDSAKQQAMLAEMQAKQQTEMKQLIADGLIEQAKQEAAAEEQRMKLAFDAQLAEQQRQHDAVMEQMRHNNQQEFDRWKVEQEMATRIEIAKIAKEGQLDSAQTAANAQITSTLGGDQNVVAELMKQLIDSHNQVKDVMGNLVEAHNTPKMVVRDANGKPIGMMPMPKGG